MFDHYYAVIMAGGGGTRLWPLSRKSKPKQLLHLIGEKSLFQISVNRLQGIFPLERVYVVTVAEQVQELMEQCPEIPTQNYIVEPMPRGTAAVVGLAAAFLHKNDPNAVMAVLTADHLIKNEEGFQDLFAAAHDVAVDNYLVTLGIQPTYPATGYGYIRNGDPIGSYRGVDVFDVLEFLEKPDQTTAQSLVADGNNSWNSGMFFWSVEQILGEFARQMQDLYSSLMRIQADMDSDRAEQTIQSVWSSVEPETIDYGIMENAEKVAVIPALDLGWSDVGSWDSLFGLLGKNESGNIIKGITHLGIDTESSLIFGDNRDRLVATIGLENVVIVDTDDVLLVCNKDRAQEVRDIVRTLKEQDNQFI